MTAAPFRSWCGYTEEATLLAPEVGWTCLRWRPRASWSSASTTDWARSVRLDQQPVLRSVYIYIYVCVCVCVCVCIRRGVG